MPVIPALGRSIDGAHTATIQGFEFKPSTSNGNPMVVVELSLPTGDLINGYIMISYNGREMEEFLRLCGELDTADALRAKHNPSFELDDLIGRQIPVVIDHGLITSFGR